MRYFRTLSNIDKHHIIIPIATLPDYGKINFKYDIRFYKWFRRRTIVKLGQEIKSGTELVEEVLSNVPNTTSPVNVEAQLSLIPVFPIELVRPAPPDKVIIVNDALNSIGNICLEILTKAKKYF